MEVRWVLGNYPRVFAIGCSLVIAVSVFFIVRRFNDKPPVVLPVIWYTDDDGQTLFPGPCNLDTPFDHNGKQAVMAHVFTTNGGKTYWIQSLQKNNDVDGKIDVLVKRPGAGQRWMSPLDPEAQAIGSPQVPAGIESGPIEMYRPK